jgi:hypothetical protein
VCRCAASARASGPGRILGPLDGAVRRESPRGGHPFAQIGSPRAPPLLPRSAVKREALVAGVTVGIATMMANPLVAEAAVTPSLKNLVNSVIAGGVLLGVIATAVTAVSSFDPIRCVVVGRLPCGARRSK